MIALLFHPLLTNIVIFLVAGKGNYWTMDPNCDELFAEGNYRRRKRRVKIQLSAEDGDGGEWAERGAGPICQTGTGDYFHSDTEPRTSNHATLREIETHIGEHDVTDNCEVKSLETDQQQTAVGKLPEEELIRRNIGSPESPEVTTSIQVMHNSHLRSPVPFSSIQTMEISRLLSPGVSPSRQTMESPRLQSLLHAKQKEEMSVNQVENLRNQQEQQRLAEIHNVNHHHDSIKTDLDLMNDTMRMKMVYEDLQSVDSDDPEQCLALNENNRKLDTKCSSVHLKYLNFNLDSKIKKESTDDEINGEFESEEQRSSGMKNKSDKLQGTNDDCFQTRLCDNDTYKTHSTYTSLTQPGTKGSPRIKLSFGIDRLIGNEDDCKIKRNAHSKHSVQGCRSPQRFNVEKLNKEKWYHQQTTETNNTNLRDKQARAKTSPEPDITERGQGHKRKRDVFEGIPNPPPKVIDLKGKKLDSLSLCLPGYLPQTAARCPTSPEAIFGIQGGHSTHLDPIHPTIETMMMYGHPMLTPHLSMTSQAYQSRYRLQSTGFPYNALL